jgi:hypothetical protein
LRAALAWMLGEAAIFVLRRDAVRRAAPQVRVPATMVLGVTAALSAFAWLRWQWQ